jgi:hypothetical protein
MFADTARSKGPNWIGCFDELDGLLGRFFQSRDVILKELRIGDAPLGIKF